MFSSISGDLKGEGYRQSSARGSGVGKFKGKGAFKVNNVDGRVRKKDEE